MTTLAPGPSLRVLTYAHGVVLLGLGAAQFVEFVLLFYHLWVPPIPESVDPEAVTPFGFELFYLAPPLGLLIVALALVVIIARPKTPRGLRRLSRVVGSVELVLGLLLCAGTLLDRWGGFTIEPVIPVINEIVTPIRFLDLIAGGVLLAIGAISFGTSRRKASRVGLIEKQHDSLPLRSDSGE